MSPVQPCHQPFKSAVTSGMALLVLLLALGAVPRTWAQSKAAPAPARHSQSPEEGVRWQELTAGQHAALKPLERDWSGISTNQKQKWLEIATKFPNLQPDEKDRIQARMSEWARMSTVERRNARVNFEQAKRVAPDDRQAQWKAYQSLPAEERRQLAARASPASPALIRNPVRPESSAKPLREPQQAKSNIVPNPLFAVPPKPVAPTVQQAQPGATTTLISNRPVPPAHQQTGMPKISAGPNFVDKATLLPKRGPQGAAIQSAGASAAQPAQRQ